MNQRAKLDSFLEGLFLDKGAEGVIGTLSFLFGAFVITKDGVVVGASQKFFDLIEYNRSELYGMSALELITPDERASMKVRFATDDSNQYELTLLAKSTQIKRSIVSPKIFYVKGEKFRLAEFIDITARIQLEERLIKQTHDLGERMKEQTALYSISRIIYLQNILLEETHKKIIEVIPTAWQYPEITCARITLNHKKSSTEKFKETAWRQASDILVHGARIGMIEVCYLEKKPELDEGPFLKEERKLINHIALIFGEAVEHRQAKLELEKSEGMLSKFLDTTPDGMIISRMRDGMIFYANPAFTTLFNYTMDEALGNTVFALNLWVRPEDRKAFLKELKKNDEIINFESKFISKDGRVIPVSLSASIVEIDGEECLVTTLRDISEIKQASKDKAKSAALYQQSLISTIRAIGMTVEKRDPYTAGHQNRVAQLSKAIAIKLKLPESQRKGIELGATIHDIGKIYIPSEILNRPGKLSNPEFNLIKSHPVVGHDIIKDISFPWPVAEMIHSHHERLDGSGYPDGLKGDEIILEAQIIAVADVVEAISSHRPYRPALGIEKALDIIQKNKGNHYKPEIVDACVSLFKNDSFEISN